MADKEFAGTSSSNSRAGPVQFEKDGGREETVRIYLNLSNLFFTSHIYMRATTEQYNKRNRIGGGSTFSAIYLFYYIQINDS